MMKLKPKKKRRGWGGNNDPRCHRCGKNVGKVTHINGKPQCNPCAFGARQ